MEIQPLGKRILVKEIGHEEQTKSGIVLPDSYKEGPDMGQVLAIGTGSEEPDLQVKDVILFDRQLSTKITIDHTDYLIIQENDILAINKR
ncbi:co-chaperone GroES [Halalkalibacterium ligniniphilum]|uniref:co-chaperone GroES n=1 Tax=Halalkalibacterium ligniniphilum TaxID=1134413 RepID=UPI0003470106|nr:co-chaperone GroES [Halalkalibacterium ligniniphilum]